MLCPMEQEQQMTKFKIQTQRSNGVWYFVRNSEFPDRQRAEEYAHKYMFYRIWRIVEIEQ